MGHRERVLRQRAPSCSPRMARPANSINLIEYVALCRDALDQSSPPPSPSSLPPPLSRPVERRPARPGRSCRSSPTRRRRRPTRRSSRPSRRRPKAPASRSRSPTATPVTRRERSSPACRPTSRRCRSSRTSRSSSRRSSPPPTGLDADEGHRHALARGARGAAGNPKQIKGWDDLAKPGVDVLTPNPFTSGGARRHVMAAYGAQLEQGQSEAEAVAYLGRLFKNVVVQDKSARRDDPHREPDRGDERSRPEGEGVHRLRDLRARAADLRRQGLPLRHRRVGGQGADPEPKGLFDITRFGGWDPVMTKFFDPKDSVMQKIEASLGVNTS